MKKMLWIDPENLTSRVVRVDEDKLSEAENYEDVICVQEIDSTGNFEVMFGELYNIKTKEDLINDSFNLNYVENEFGNYTFDDFLFIENEIIVHPKTIEEAEKLTWIIY